MNMKLIVEGTSMPDWILLALFCMALLIQCYYYLVVYTRLPRFKPPGRKKSTKGVSIVICARNEAENLEKFLPLVLEQDYPEFEVVVVNDSSTDQSEDLLSELKVQYPKLRYTNIPHNEKFPHGKKLALTIGLKAARFDLILLTDADCYPSGKRWLQNMSAHLRGKTEIVLGYGKYEKRRGLLNLIIRYETVFTAIQFFSFALRGKPYMGVGRNLAYRKEFFFKSGGFSNHYHIPSGDDDLFVNQNATRENISVEIEEESHTISIPEATAGAWIRQKRRHLKAGNLYKTGSRIRLGTELISRLLLYASLVSIALVTSWLWPSLILFSLFLGIRMTVFKMGMMRLNEKYLLLPSLLLDPLLPLVLGIIWISNIFVTRNQSWS